MILSDLQDYRVECAHSGFPGCIRSFDANRIIMERCFHRLRQHHIGFKVPHTSRTYNITVNLCWVSVSKTVGYPICFNDKILVLFDAFINKMFNGGYNEWIEFELLDFDSVGNNIGVKYKGCYVIVGNGNLA